MRGGVTEPPSCTITNFAKKYNYGKRKRKYKTVSSNNASKTRTLSNAATNTTTRGKMSVSDVKTPEDAYRLMQSYDNLYNMPKDEQKKFTDSFGQMMIDNFNKKHNEYEDSFNKKSSEAFAKKDENLYKSAEKSYNALMRSLREERKIVTDKYNEFVKIKK